MVARAPGRPVTPVVLTVAVAVALFVVAAHRHPDQAAAQPSPDDVRQVYLRDCAVCHGSTGEGTNRGPTLVGVGRASAHYWLSTGRMPISEPDQEIERRPPQYPRAMVAALVDYVDDFGPGGPNIPVVDPAEGDLAQGGELYRLQCAACHSWSGVGGALLFADAPPVTPATPTQVAEAVRVGPGDMPAFGRAALSDAELNSVVAYTEYLDDPDDRGGNPLWHLGPLAEGGIAIVVALGLVLLAIRWIGTSE